MTLRVLAALREADVVACEDTRRTRVLLDRYGVDAPSSSRYHEHNERARGRASSSSGCAAARSSRSSPTPACRSCQRPGLRARAGVRGGRAGGRGAARARARRSRRSSPAALPADRWRFVGFLPRKRGELEPAARDSAGETLVAFESPRAGGRVARGARRARPRAAGRGLPRADQAPRGGRARHGGGARRALRRRATRAARSCSSSAPGAAGASPTLAPGRSPRCARSSTRAPSRGRRPRWSPSSRAERERALPRADRRGSSAERRAPSAPGGLGARRIAACIRRSPRSCRAAPRRRPRSCSSRPLRPAARPRLALAGRGRGPRGLLLRAAPTASPRGQHRGVTFAAPAGAAVRRAVRRAGRVRGRGRVGGDAASRSTAAADATLTRPRRRARAPRGRRPRRGRSVGRRERRGPARRARCATGRVGYLDPLALHRRGRADRVRAGPVAAPSARPLRGRPGAGGAPARPRGPPTPTSTCPTRARGRWHRHGRGGARHAVLRCSRRPRGAGCRSGRRGSGPSRACAALRGPRLGSESNRSLPAPPSAPGAAVVAGGQQVRHGVRPRLASRRRVLLRHDADLLRQRGAASRARVHDDRGRRPGPAHAPARGGRLLPHRHRRARRAGRPGRRGEGVTPQELADRNAERFRALLPRLERPERLLHPHHRPRARGQGRQEVLQRVHDNGHVYKGLYEGWYCPRCADFKTETEIGPGQHLPDPRDPARRASSEENWFFRLSAFQEPLEQLYAEHPDFVLPRNRYNEAQCVHRPAACRTSRSRAPELRWGVTVPWDPDQVFYVWFDALLNYYTALASRAPART